MTEYRIVEYEEVAALIESYDGEWLPPLEWLLEKLGISPDDPESYWVESHLLFYEMTIWRSLR